ncbi:hypothetical protein CgunFtcFv8_023223 [Champsocephalus gunnari]|uniref:Uncharacterized protein n=1 Tax=Champsocephalus gunnari TaxID=52237 RepID=A0AAN8DFT5_CHAGU|nr:hypothetical protein CgunFtcFv8_023223 [Champsocephalus gunnari]
MQPSMITNTTENPTLVSNPTAGLAVGLTLFFLLMVIIAGVIVYKFNKVRDMLQLGKKRRQKKEDFAETPQDDSHQYTSRIHESTEQNPIYENLTTQTTRNNRPEVEQNKFSSEPEEDVYLQCDSPDDAIYSNDPSCNLSILPDSRDEDVYIMPDS